MNKTMAKPKLTEHQRYTLGMAVQTAYLSRNWDGKSKGAEYPKVWESERYRSHGTSIPSIKAMLRAKVLEPSTKGAYPLTKAGLRIGEEECLERMGISPRQTAEELREQKEKEKAERELEIDAVVRPFKDIKVKSKGKGRAVDLAKALRDKIERSHRVEFTEDELRELGVEIERLRSA